jgi:hypothetical protein
MSGVNESKKLAPEFHRLLDRYATLFQEPMGLPPTRAHDHKIPTLLDHELISIRPYHYSFYQKNEIGK